jgi:hypothetical protein
LPPCSGSLALRGEVEEQASNKVSARSPQMLQRPEAPFFLPPNVPAATAFCETLGLKFLDRLLFI